MEKITQRQDVALKVPCHGGRGSNTAESYGSDENINTKKIYMCVFLCFWLNFLHKSHTNKTLHGGGLEERICSVVWWYGRGYFCISCQTAAG